MLTDMLSPLRLLFALATLLSLHASSALAATDPPPLRWSDAPDPTPPGDDLEVDWGAHLRPRLEARWRSEGTPPLEKASFRARFHLRARRGDLESFFQPQATGLWGGTGGLHRMDPALGLHQAWFRYGSRRWDIQAGRFLLSYGDERVLAQANWNQTARAWDGVRGRLRPLDGAQLDLFVTKYGEASATSDPRARPAWAQDDYLAGAYLTLDRDLARLADVELFALWDQRTTFDDEDAAAPPVRRRLSTLGARLDGAFGPATLVTEGVGQLGRRCELRGLDARQCRDGTSQDVALAGWMLDVDVDVALPGPFKLDLGGVYASGDDPDTDDRLEGYDPLYASAHRYLGLADLFDRQDVIEARAGAGIKQPTWRLDLLAHHFWTATAQSRGVEVDATARVELTPGVDLQAHYSFFTPTGASTDAPSHFAFVMTRFELR